MTQYLLVWASGPVDGSGRITFQDGETPPWKIRGFADMRRALRSIGGMTASWTTKGAVDFHGAELIKLQVDAYELHYQFDPDELPDAE